MGNNKVGYLFSTNVPTGRRNRQEHLGWIFIPHKCSKKQTYPGEILGLDIYSSQTFIKIDLFWRNIRVGYLFPTMFQQTDLTCMNIMVGYLFLTNVHKERLILEEHQGWIFIPHKSSNRQTLSVRTLGLDINSSQMFQQTYLSGGNIRVGYLFLTKV